MNDMRRTLDALDRHCAGLMAQESIGDLPITIQYSADIWYIGQSYHLEVKLALEAAAPIGALCRDFLALHGRIYGHATEQPAAIVNLRSVHRAGGSGHLDEGEYRPSGADPSKPPRSIRVAGDQAPVQASIYLREAMPPGMSLSGPAIVEQTDTTTLVEPSWHGTVLENGNLLLTRG